VGVVLGFNGVATIRENAVVTVGIFFDTRKAEPWQLTQAVRLLERSHPMKISNCPTCGGSKTLPFIPLGMNSVDRLQAPVPCPTCQDSDGNPTGRIAVLSNVEVDYMVRNGEIIKSVFVALMTENTHRAKAQTPHRYKEKGEGE
jgi:hypothetical protein